MFKFSLSAFLLFALFAQLAGGYLVNTGLNRQYTQVSSNSFFSEDTRKGIPVSFIELAKECEEKKESKASYIPEGWNGRPCLVNPDAGLFKFSNFAYLPGNAGLFLLNKTFRL